MKLIDRFKNFFAKEPPPMIDEIGATGTAIFSGQIFEVEYNPDLQGAKGLDIFEKMRKSDGQVKAGLLACTLPLLSAHWDILPGSDSAEDVEIAAIIRENLFEGMTITWDNFLRQALLMLTFGFSVFEKVWELKDGLYQWRKLAPRQQKTITKWFTDPEGGLAGVEQQAFKQMQYITTPIPVTKLLVFTNELEGSNFTGVSLLRAAYKHWYYKNNLYAIDGIAAERHGVGLATFAYPKNTGTVGKEAIKNVGQRLQAHERAYVALPDDIKFALQGVAGQLHDIKGSIEHHDLQIVRSILAQFINLGSTDVGSMALSKDQSGFFLMALRAVSRNFCESMNRYGIRQLVDYNWNIKGKYPKLTVSDLESFDLPSFSKAVTDFSNAGLLTADDDIEVEIRRLLKLPASKPGAVPRTKPTQEQPEETEAKARRGGAVRLRAFVPRRALQGVEQHVAFAEIQDKLDDVEERFIKAVAPIQKKQIAKMVNIMADYLEDGEYERIAEIDVPYRDKVADAVESLLLELMDFGEEQVRQEYQKQLKVLVGADIDIPKPPSRQAFLHVRALAIANILANKLRAAMAWEALHQIKEGVLDKAALTAALAGLTDRTLRSTIKTSAKEAFDLGGQS